MKNKVVELELFSGLVDKESILIMNLEKYSDEELLLELIKRNKSAFSLKYNNHGFPGISHDIVVSIRRGHSATIYIYDDALDALIYDDKCSDCNTEMYGYDN